MPLLPSVQNGNDLAAISFGLQHLSESSASHPAGPEMIADAAVMLAFPDTPGLRCSDLRLSYRRKLASAINSSLQVGQVLFLQLLSPSPLPFLSPQDAFSTHVLAMMTLPFGQVRAGRPAHSSLERMLSQLALVHKNLEAAGDTLMNLLPLENQGLTVVDDPK